MQREFWSDIGRQLSDGVMCGHGQDLTPNESTSFAADSHARQYRLRDGAEEWLTNDGYGESFVVLSKSSDRDTCWSKMSGDCCQRMMDGRLEEFSGTWPASGTMRAGTCYRQPPLVLRIFVKGSSFWRTPGASETTGGAADAMDRKSQGHSVSLSDQVNTPEMWPTPTAGGRTAGPSPAEKCGGSLNPQFVAWMLGLPIDWCDMPDEQREESQTESRSSDA